MALFLPIAGTHGWHGETSPSDWYHPQSPFVLFLAAHDLQHLCPERPFVWSTDLDGAPFSGSDHTDWKAAGWALYDYLVPATVHCATVLHDRNVIAHSHGLQAVLYASANGLTINTLVSVSSPVRKDMMEVARKARPNIGYWLHLHSDNSDRVQWFGEIGDGAFGIVREHPLADRNDAVPSVGHSDILFKPEDFHYWVDRKWVDALKH